VRKEVTPKDGESGEELAVGQWAAAMTPARHVTSRRSTYAMPEPAEVKLYRSIALQCWCQIIQIVTVTFLFIYYIKIAKNIYIYIHLFRQASSRNEWLTTDNVLRIWFNN
jgi:hypothetical protein